jgi:hypothetical protein
MMYVPEAFDRGYRDLPDKSDDVMPLRRKAHHIRTQPGKEVLPRPRTTAQSQALRYLKTGELEDAELQLDLDSEQLRSICQRAETPEDWLEAVEAVNTAYRTRLSQLRNLSTWKIYPEMAEQFRTRHELSRRYSPWRFWNWPPIPKPRRRK